MGILQLRAKQLLEEPSPVTVVAAAYLSPADVVLKRLPRGGPDGSECATAEIFFKKIEDARRAKQALQGQNFGGYVLEIEYALGRPARTLWIGYLLPATTEEALRAHCEQYGPLERFELKRKGSGGGTAGSASQSTALVSYKDQVTATRAVEAMRALGRLGNNLLRIVYASPDGQQGNSKREPAAGANGAARTNDSTPRERDRERERERERDRERGDFPPAHGYAEPPLPLQPQQQPTFHIPPADRAAVEEALANGLRYFLAINVLSPKDIDDIHAIALRVGPHTPAYLVRLVHIASH